MFHKECAHSLPEIIHPAHPDHPLVLDLNIVEGPCSLCQQQFWRLVMYHCSICDFRLDLGCARKPPSLSIEHTTLHEHPLVCSSLSEVQSYGNYTCKVCHGLHIRSIDYACGTCKIYFHRGCIELFPEVDHTSHPKHPLKFIVDKPPVHIRQVVSRLGQVRRQLVSKQGEVDGTCVLCGVKIQRQMHHCDVCNYTICKDCAKDPPPLEVTIPTTHEHQLHLIPRQVVFTCNACGTQGDQSPYFCLLCNYMIHRECIGLPRVININRHDHRISYTCYLRHGNSKCGVCRQKMNGVYGAYACLKCPSYAVHLRCAIRDDVWDKIKLEGVPEEEEIAPFEVIDEDIIKHFGHDHNLRHNKDGTVLGEGILCKACVLQVYPASFYSCEQCDFVLHQICANLPRRKRHVSYTRAFTLHLETRGSVRRATSCSMCQEHFTGFRYVSGNRILDVRCASVSEPFIHASHPHPLFYNENKDCTKKCVACGVDEFKTMLSCDECVFSLHFKCALLPQTVMRQRYDDHPLSLCYGENDADAGYWCDVCEKKLDPTIWFYTCDDCGVTLHVSCIVGDLSYQIPGGDTTSEMGTYEVVPNTSVNRHVCDQCGSRCIFPFIIKFGWKPYCSYFCSDDCFGDT